MLRARPFALLAACLASALPAAAEGTFKGRVFVGNDPSLHCYEMHIVLSRDGGGWAAPLRIGVIPNENDTYPNSIIRHSGEFLFHLTPGRYTAVVCEPRFFPRGHVFRDIVIEEGKTLERDLPLPADYAVGATKTGPWGKVNAQSFKASGTSIIKIAFKPAGIQEGVPDPHVRVTVREGGLDGKAVGPARVVPIKPQGDCSVAYRHGDVPTTPGKTYVVEMRPAKPGGGDADFGWIPYVGPPDACRDGTAYVDGKPVEHDFHMAVQGDADGVIQTLGRISGSDFKSLLPEHGWSHIWGQTFKAKGSGLAGVDWYATCGFGKHFAVECAIYDDPNGKPIGPAKTVHTCSDLAYGASWSPGEVPLTPGKTYCVRFRRVDHTKEEKDHSGFNFYRMRQEDYADGQLYLLDGGKLAPAPGADGDIRIFEYADVPGKTVSSPAGGGLLAAVPAPKGGRDAGVKNGAFEDGGSEGIPAGWTRWQSSFGRWQKPTFWNNAGQGRDQSKSSRILGGNINSTTFDGGVVQRVSGLDPKKKYQVVAHVSTDAPTGAINGAALGFDPSGQAGDFRAATWVEAPARPGAGFVEIAGPPFSPKGDSASVWTRAWLYFFDCGTTYVADFDDVRLVETP